MWVESKPARRRLQCLRQPPKWRQLQAKQGVGWMKSKFVVGAVAALALGWSSTAFAAQPDSRRPQ